LLDVGDRIGGFEIEAYVARGGMAMVYRAREIGLGRRVAIKVIAPELAQNPMFRQRFTQESQLAASIDHPNIIPIYAAGDADGQLYLVMRYVDGDTLGAVLAKHGPLSVADALAIFDQVAGALDAAHAHHLVHRDVKPRNILLAPGSDLAHRHVYLTDFGITKRVSGDTTMTTAEQFVGTIRYVAPEQISSSPISNRADIYSLACVMVEALTGQPPYVRADEAALIWSHMSEEPPAVSERRPDLPQAVDAVFRRALAKDPAERQGSCRALVADLADALTPLPRDPADNVISDNVIFGASALAAGDGGDDDPPTIPSAKFDTAAPPPSPAPVPSPPPASAATVVATPDRPYSASPVPMPPPRDPRWRRWLPALIAGVVLLGVLAGVLIVALLGRQPIAAPAAESETPSPTPSATPTRTPSPTPTPTVALPRSAEALPENTMVWRREDGGLWTIATVPVDGDDSTVLISGRSNRSVQLTPDRQTVLYLREFDERITLRAMSADGEQDRALFSDGSPDCPRMSRPTIRADGVLALFCAEASGGRGTLNVMSQDGTLLRVLDRGRIGDPTFTPDGKSIIYWRTEADGGQGGALFRVPADGSDQPEEVLAAEEFEYTDPAISPDGDRMLASRSRGDTQEIVAVTLTGDPGTDVDRLTKGSLDQGPSWSPDGSKIIFRRGTDDESDLYVIKANGKGVRQVFHADGYASEPVWTAQ
jgi:serine/threonine-protein kinase